MAEGSVWEAANIALHYKLDNLCGVVDVNGLGQSQATQFDHQMEAIAARWTAFGWHTIVVDGHDIPSLLKAYAEARATKGRPTMVLARTLKGKGLAAIEGKDGWHGKALKKGEEADKAMAELQKQMVDAGGAKPVIPMPQSKGRPDVAARLLEDSRPRLQDRRPGRDARSVGHGARGPWNRRRARRRARRRRQELDLQRQVREGQPRSLLRELHCRAGHGRRGHGPCGARRDSVPLDVCLLSDARGRFHPHGRHLVLEREVRRVRTPACRSARTARRRWRSRICR